MLSTTHILEETEVENEKGDFQHTERQGDSEERHEADNFDREYSILDWNKLKSPFEEPPELELKKLHEHLEYGFLGNDKK